MKTTILVVVALAVVALIILAKMRKPSGSIAADDAVIEQLRKAGSDLARPHSVEFYIYLPSKDAALRVSEELGNRGYSVVVESAATGPEWLALASKQLIPTSDALAGERRVLSEIAIREGGKYDGWGTEVVK